MHQVLVCDNVLHFYAWSHVREEEEKYEDEKGEEEVYHCRVCSCFHSSRDTDHPNTWRQIATWDVLLIL